MLLAGVVMSHYQVALFAHSPRWAQLLWYVAAFLPVGVPVVREAVEGIMARDFFNEFTLMTVACIGAFCIGEWPEAVGVMLFYSIGETLQHGAVDRATRNISQLLDVRPETATLVNPASGSTRAVAPDSVTPGQLIEVAPGGRVPLDGTLESANGLFDTSALTGESVPRELTAGQEVLAGMISAGSAVRIRVSRAYSQSALARILEMVGRASGRKAHAELFIRRFARIYTPIVMGLAVLLVAVPWLVGMANPQFHFEFSRWLYRALVFLVISCPCALVISVPLGYFAGIGAASRRGILFKGGSYLDVMARVNMVAFDKTGTLTTGRFSVTRVHAVGSESTMLALLASAESTSTHPLARALCGYVASRNIEVPAATAMTERPGHGAEAMVDGHRVLAGNTAMLRDRGISYPAELDSADRTVIVCVVDGSYAGHVTLADTVRPDSAEAVASLAALGVNRLVMLSGDRPEVVASTAASLGLTEAHGGMLPQDKARFVEAGASTPGSRVAFVGDGMNDAPVLALSNVGVAMGGLGSDAAIESADVVIQTDRPSRVATAIRIGRATRAIVMQNIVGAIGIKVVILLLGAMGYASLWAAVFADVGVALLAVLNSMRIMWKKY